MPPSRNTSSEVWMSVAIAVLTATFLYLRAQPPRLVASREAASQPGPTVVAPRAATGYAPGAGPPGERADTTIAVAPGVVLAASEPTATAADTAPGATPAAASAATALPSLRVAAARPGPHLSDSTATAAAADDRNRAGVVGNAAAARSAPIVPPDTAAADAFAPGNAALRRWALEISETDEEENRLWRGVAGVSCPVDFAVPVGVQLAPFRAGGITQDMLDGLYCVRKHVARVSVDARGTVRQENWQLGLDHNRLRSGMWLLQLAVRRAAVLGRPVPPVEMLLNPTDKTADFASGKKKNSPEAERLRQTPLFCNAKCEDDHSISFPMYLHPLYGLPDGQMGLARYAERRAELQRMGSGETWHAKENRMFFSATNTRGHRAAMFSVKSPNLEAVHKKVPVAHYGRYRYSVYTYGHSGWSARLRELTFMNTTVFMEASQCREYYHHLFRAGEHYVPVSGDLSDLGDKLDDAVAHPKRSAAMAARWLERGRDVLSLECVLEYVAELLREYAKLQRFVPADRPGWSMHHLNSTTKYFLASSPPDLDTCRRFF